MDPGTVLFNIKLSKPLSGIEPRSSSKQPIADRHSLFRLRITICNSDGILKRHDLTVSHQ